MKLYSETPVECPCLILALADPADTALASRILRRLGWDVYTARNGPEVRRLARMLEPEWVILGATLPCESGWLTCDKLTREMPALKVLLVEADPANNAADFANFVGAEGLARSLFELSYRIPAHRDGAALLTS